MKKLDKTTHIEKKIAIVMRIGVAVAALFMIVGFILLEVNFKDYFAGFSDVSLGLIWNGLFSFNPYSYMMFGILILILTPVIRVVASIILFAKTKDKLYTAITATVLAILMISFIVGTLIS